MSEARKATLRAPRIRASLLAAALVGCATRTPPPLYELPDFSLVAQDGRPVTKAALAGAPWIADFIFTRCAGICPAMTARLARLRPRLPGETRLVSFTVDPGHDSPAVLARYAAPWQPGERWLFVSGARDALYRLAGDGFKLAVMELPPSQPPGDDGPFVHSGKLVLVDARGRIRGYYDHDDEAALTRLVADAQRVRLEGTRLGSLPALNATLNGASALLLATGFAFIRLRRRDAHRVCMLAALGCSAVFLASYLLYHSQVGSVRFAHEGSLRALYLTILVSHTILAVAILPLVGMTVVQAARARFDRHRRVARWTLPLWMYVSVTGVVVYWMLYRM